MQDPHIDESEAKRLLKEMMTAVKRVSKDTLVVITADETGCYESIFAKFKNRLELYGGETLRVSASSEYKSKEFAMPGKALAMVRVP